MAQIIVRSLGPNNDPLFGNSQSNFLSDINAVAQIILTRLRLLTGEWWENLADGTPLFQSILGAANTNNQLQTIANLLIQRILGTPFVTGVSNVQTYFDSSLRALQFACVVTTQFGSISIVSNAPGMAAAVVA